MRQTPDTIKHLIIINVIMFLATQMMPQQMENFFAMHFPLNPQFKVWQLITHMFMHGGIMHIAFNMYGLWAFGTPLYHIWGEKKFLIFYFAAGLGAVLLYTGVQYYSFNQSLNELISQGLSKDQIIQILNSWDYHSNVGINLHNLISQGLPKDEIIQIFNSKEYLGDFKNISSIYHLPALGASGAIYGLLVAFAFYFPNAELMLMFIPYPIKAKYFVPLLVLLDLTFGLTNVLHTPIAHMAHVGGALVGFFLMKLWQKHDHQRWY